jgi:hypothetical protein
MRNRWIDLAEGPRARVEEIRQALGSLNAGGDFTQAAELGRLERVLSTIDQRFVGRRAELMAIGTIQDVNNLLAQAANTTRQTADQIANGAAVSLGPVNDVLDRALQALAASPAPLATPKVVSDAANDFDEETSAIIAKLQAQAQQIEADTSSMRADAERAVAAARDEMAAAQGESNRAIEENVQKLRELQTRVDTLIDTQQGVFSKALEDQRGEFSALLKSTDEESDRRASEERARWDGAFADNADRAAVVLAKMNDVLSDSERIANIIAEKGLVSGYQKQAQEEATSSRRWRILTVVLGVGAVVFLAVAAFHPGAGSEGWVATAAKAGASVALGTLAYFTARVGTRHYARAAHYRSRELALATFRPYLEQLPADERTILIAKMAPDFFKELEENSSTSDWQPQATGILEKAAAELLSRNSGKA